VIPKTVAQASQKSCIVFFGIISGLNSRQSSRNVAVVLSEANERELRVLLSPSLFKGRAMVSICRPTMDSVGEVGASVFRESSIALHICTTSENLASQHPGLSREPG
jgi:hypothetical protein